MGHQPLGLVVAGGAGGCVTGGGGGIGGATCRRFAAEGAKVAVLDLDQAQKQRLQVSDLIEKFHEVAGEAFAVDRLLLE